jgi:hypothetical protein
MTALYFYNGIQQLEKDSSCKNMVKHMKCLFRIFCLHSLTTQGAALAQSQYLTPEHFRMISELLQEEYRTIRPQMLNLIEASELDDNIMMSAIGNYDGNVYERLMDWARSSRLNDKDVLPGFNEHIRPFLAAKL